MEVFWAMVPLLGPEQHINLCPWWLIHAAVHLVMTILLFQQKDIGFLVLKVLWCQCSTRFPSIRDLSELDVPEFTVFFKGEQKRWFCVSWFKWWHLLWEPAGTACRPVPLATKWPNICTFHFIGFHLWCVGTVVTGLFLSSSKGYVDVPPPHLPLER